MINKANTKEDSSKSNSIQTIINKRLKFHNLTIFVRPIFQKDKKYYPQVLLDESSYELYMLVFDKVDFSERMMLIKQMHQKMLYLSLLVSF